MKLTQVSMDIILTFAENLKNFRNMVTMKLLPGDRIKSDALVTIKDILVNISKYQIQATVL